MDVLMVALRAVQWDEWKVVLMDTLMDVMSADMSVDQRVVRLVDS
jgi:hypothetical protein